VLPRPRSFEQVRRDGCGRRIFGQLQKRQQCVRVVMHHVVRGIRRHVDLLGQRLASITYWAMLAIIASVTCSGCHPMAHEEHLDSRSRFLLWHPRTLRVPRFVPPTVPPIVPPIVPPVARAFRFALVRSDAGTRRRNNDASLGGSMGWRTLRDARCTVLRGVTGAACRIRTDDLPLTRRLLYP
jgi:hypothetical protein